MHQVPRPKSQSRYKLIKTYHSFHIVDPSPWPFFGSYGSLILTTGLTMYMHKIKNGFGFFLLGILIISLVAFFWFRDIVREALYEDAHTAAVRRGLWLAMILFIISEIMFFFALFWAFFYSSIAPGYKIGAVWPPKAIVPIKTFGLPFTNTCVLISSGITVSWAHSATLAKFKREAVKGLLWTLFLAVCFLALQSYEYLNAPFNISDSVYGSCFYMTTGFHGFHVFLGTIALLVAFIRLTLNHFTRKRHFGLEAAIWYWHFVDVVWVFLFVSVYWWGNN